MEGIKNVIIIGAMKCGTTSLYHYLVQHPEICPGKYKEPEYFSLNMPGENPSCKEASYENLFDVQPEHKFTLDASTGYSKYPAESGVPERMNAYGLKPYFVYVIRNPFDRIESHFNFMRDKLYWKNKIDSEHLIHTSNYNLQLKQYEPFFSKDRILILDFENLKADPINVCKHVYDFIGAKDCEIDYQFEVRNVTQPVNRTRIRIRNATKGLSSILPGRVHKFTSKVLDKLFPAGKKRKLSSNQRKTIHTLLEKDMKELEANYGIDVRKWGFKA